MTISICSGALVGVEALPVTVQVSLGRGGEERYRIVGLPDAAVRESVSRVISAISASGLHTVVGAATVNLAPGDLRKEGPLYDLPIALGFIAAANPGSLPLLDDTLVAGELGLAGETRPVRGALALARLARAGGLRRVVLPALSAIEGALVDGIEVHAVASLREAVELLDGTRRGTPLASPLGGLRAGAQAPGGLDFADVKGQATVRRAVEVAVAGSHNLLLVGPPGSGKSMIAKRVPSIMPRPTEEEFLDILAVKSAASRAGADPLPSFRRPFRAPHHTISDVGLIGGGTIPGPGEISLAHRGVLFLDELPEFRRSALEVLRQPLEDGHVSLSRSAGKVTLPCDFMLVAAMNPCPCGHLGDPRRACRCPEPAVRRYRSRLSGPLLDRIDLHVEAPALAVDELASDRRGEPSSAMRDRVERARAQQAARLRGTGVETNARMTPALLEAHAPLSPALVDLLRRAMDRLRLSARAWDRVRKVARTIADLAGADAIAAPHLLEAIQYRSLDRES